MQLQALVAIRAGKLKINSRLHYHIRNSMSRKVYYRYNPSTGGYERVYPSRAQHVWGWIRHALFAIMMGTIIVTAIYYTWETPREKLLREQNRDLRERLDILCRRLDASSEVINDIIERDDNFYRVMMGAPRLSASERQALIDDDYEYARLSSLSDAELIGMLSHKMDLVEEQLAMQSQSFDELRRLAASGSERMQHIPSIQPLRTEAMKAMASGYGYRSDPIYGTSRFHEGLDFAANIGTPVFATARGRVVKAGWESGYGNMVEIDHGYDYVTRYAHLSKFNVKTGDSVGRGDEIGSVGNTGKSTGPHLHYEVRYKGAPQNPINYYFMDITPDEYNELIRQAENAGHVMD
jgi:murein DD-endopeptidase MepM/ murein hydrolase activator NlpD